MTERPIRLTVVGTIRTAHTERDTVPAQGALNPDEQGRVVVEPEYRDALLELDTFDFAWLVTWLAAVGPDPGEHPLRQTPFLLTERRRDIGLFAMRGPRRPNPIGLHLVRIVEVGEEGFTFAGVDMLDGSAVLDIKPWAAPLDLPYGRHLDRPVRSGWFDTADLTLPASPAARGITCDRAP